MTHQARDVVAGGTVDLEDDETLAPHKTGMSCGTTGDAPQERPDWGNAKLGHDKTAG